MPRESGSHFSGENAGPSSPEQTRSNLRDGRITRRGFLRGAGAALGLLASGGLSERVASAQARPERESDPEDESREWAKLLENEPLPKAWIRTLDPDGTKFGTRKALSHRGIQIINIWGTYCAPCTKEMPKFTEIAERLDQVGIQTHFILDTSWDTDDKILESVRAMYAREASFKKDPKVQERLSARLSISNLKEELEKLLLQKLKTRAKSQNAPTNKGGVALGIPITMVVYEGKMMIRFSAISDEGLEGLAQGLIDRVKAEGQK